jgi:hypothetical protein
MCCVYDGLEPHNHVKSYQLAFQTLDLEMISVFSHFIFLVILGHQETAKGYGLTTIAPKIHRHCQKLKDAFPKCLPSILNHAQ